MTAVIRGKKIEKGGIRFHLRRFFGNDIAVLHDCGRYCDLYSVVEFEYDGREGPRRLSQLAGRIKTIVDLHGFSHAVTELPDRYAGAVWHALDGSISRISSRAAYLRMLPAVLETALQLTGIPKGGIGISICDLDGESPLLIEAVETALTLSNSVSILTEAGESGYDALRERIMTERGASLMITGNTAHLKNTHVALFLSGLTGILKSGEFPSEILAVDFDEASDIALNRPNIVTGAEISLPDGAYNMDDVSVNENSFTAIVLASMDNPSDEGCKITNLLAGNGRLGPDRVARLFSKINLT